MTGTQGVRLPRGRRADLNGVADEVAAVEAARERLGRDIDHMTDDVRAEVSTRVQKLVWKLAASGAAIVVGVGVRKALIAAWRGVKHDDPPANPADPQTTWSDAIAWTIASGVAVAAGRLVAQRGAAAAYQKATGHLPPGLEQVAP